MKLNRSPVSRRHVQLLLSFYKDRTCVVDGVSTDVNWHHLDDDNRNSRFENLVPLRGEYNTRLNCYRDAVTRKIPFEEDPKLRPDVLAALAERHLLTGRPYLGYGAARVGVFVIKNYLPRIQENYLSHVAMAIHCLRHSFHELLFEDVLNRDCLTVPQKWMSSKVNREGAFRFILEIGSFLQDRGLVNESDDLLDTGERLLKTRKLKAADSLRSELRWRRGLNFAYLGNFAKAFDYFQESKESAETSARQEAHILRSEGTLHLMRNKFSKSKECFLALRDKIVRKSGEPRHFLTTNWAAAASLVLLTYASNPKTKREWASARENIADARSYLIRAGSALSPTQSAGPFVGINISLILSTCGTMPVQPPGIGKKTLEAIRETISRIV